MASEGPNSPSTAVNQTGIGTISWNNPGNATASDDASASFFAGSPATTNWLEAANFGFSIPGGATIDGIIVEWEKNGTGSIRDNAVRIVKGGTIGSTDRSISGFWAGSDTYVSHGSSSDLWGETWSSSDINASDFGAALSAENTGVGAGSIDHVRITVHYTAGAATLRNLTLLGVGQ